MKYLFKIVQQKAEKDSLDEIRKRRFSENALNLRLEIPRKFQNLHGQKNIFGLQCHHAL